MTPRKLPTAAGSLPDAEARLDVAEAYLEAATVLAGAGGSSRNTCIGNAVLAGIAAADATCLAVLGERYSGHDHIAAADLLERVNKGEAVKLRRLVALKTAAHYGARLLSAQQEASALKHAHDLVERASDRLVTGS